MSITRPSVVSGDSLGAGPDQGSWDDLDSRLQIDALYHLAVELSGLRSVDSVLDVALRHCLTLTGSQFGFIGLCGQDPTAMDVAAVQGFHPSPEFYSRHRLIPLRPNIFARAVLDNRPVRSSDARQDPDKVGQPQGHPEVRTFLGVPLRIADRPIGMIGVANRPAPYEGEHERLLLTYAAQVAIVIRNAQLYEQLATANGELEEMVETRTTQLLAASRKLEEKAAELQIVLSQTVEAQEQERQRIAREIHDGVNQSLIAAMLELTSSQHRLDRGAVEEAREALGSAQQILRTVESEIRQVLRDLHPPVLEGLGLPAALRRLGESFSKQTGVKCRTTVGNRTGRLAGPVEVSLYRIAQEALHNVAAHAEAERVTVTLRFDNDDVALEVTDNGSGFDPVQAKSNGHGHLGLRSMRHRAESLGGRFQVDTSPGRGTTVRAVLPI
ncbi:MAG TPA: GAF domain-containing sensor histidine kinase [Acidimicrobiia bacterium]|nr:GAF domain-containing sensor histidine kinase [Acidimicrobiia bacterium]